ncbi:MAG: hypothetical protein R3F56_21495 [Planctomycetota bacterium]
MPTPIPNRTTLLLILVAGLASAATLVLAIRPLPASADLQGELASLVAELRALRQDLRRETYPAVAAVASPSSPTAQARRDPLPDPALDARLDKLVASIGSLVAVVRDLPRVATAAARSPLDPRLRDTGEQWSAIDPFVELHRRDPQAARRSILFLTAREVVERFGIPTESGAGKGSMWMAYQRKDERGKVVMNLHLGFADGIVMFCELEVQ